MSPSILLRRGLHSVRIAPVRLRGRDKFELTSADAGRTTRQVCPDLPAAKRAARLALRRLCAGAAQTDPGFANKSARQSQALPSSPAAAGCPPERPLAQLIADFAETRRAMGVAPDYVTNISRQLGRIAAVFPGRALIELRTPELDRWLGAQPWQPVTKNDARKIAVTFGNWARANGYLPIERPSAFAAMVSYRVPPTTIGIYSPAELQRILAAVEAERPELVPWAVCAAFTGARVSELATLDWAQINFARGFIELASRKVRTKARRLVPLHDILRTWLEPHRRESGPVTDYADPRAALGRIATRRRLVLRHNAFRHSYISHRLAQIHDTARVALECGNSPEVIFQHYRELVAPEDAAAWFSTAPRLGGPLEPMQPAGVPAACIVRDPSGAIVGGAAGALETTATAFLSRPRSLRTTGRLWTAREVAGYLGCSAGHVSRLRRAGLPHFRLGRLTRFDPDEVRDFLRGPSPVPVPSATAG